MNQYIEYSNKEIYGYAVEHGHKTVRIVNNVERVGYLYAGKFHFRVYSMLFRTEA